MQVAKQKAVERFLNVLLPRNDKATVTEAMRAKLEILVLRGEMDHPFISNYYSRAIQKWADRGKETGIVGSELFQDRSRYVITPDTVKIGEVGSQELP